MIKGDRLWLINSDAGRATIYDKDLKEIKTCKYNPEDYDGNCDTSDSDDGDVPNPGNYYDVSQIATSADGNTLSCQVSHPIPTNMQSLI